MSVAGLLAKHAISPQSVAGDRELQITSIANPENAEAGSLIFAEGRRLAAVTAGTRATVIVHSGDATPSPGRCHIRVEDPRAWFIAALGLLYHPVAGAAIDPTARIDAAAKLGRGCRIGAFTVIERGVEVGDNTTIGSHSLLRSDTLIGAGVTIQHHVTIGSEGVAFHRDAADAWHFFPHHGRVRIGDGVAVGSHAVIVRGMLGDTVIGGGSKLGNFVNVGHNCQIGENCWLSSNVVLCGAARLEADVRLAASVSISDHVLIGCGARIGLGSIVTKDVPSGAVMFGNPARPLRTMRPF